MYFKFASESFPLVHPNFMLNEPSGNISPGPPVETPRYPPARARKGQELACSQILYLFFFAWLFQWVRFYPGNPVQGVWSVANVKSVPVGIVGRTQFCPAGLRAADTRHY